jgi:hypothetical protein
MTESHRDLNPPRGPAREDTPWELVLGHSLEQSYGYFTEIHFVFTDGLADHLAEELPVARRWMTTHLTRADVPRLLIAAADHALADIRRWTHPSVFTDPELNRRRRAIRDTFEVLEQVTRSHVRPERRRYFDLGIALSRVNLCVILDHLTPALPSAVHRAWPGLDKRYRAELWRSCAMLVSFVRDEDGDTRPDPALRDLDDAFRALADCLEPRVATEGPIDEELLDRLHAASLSTGLSRCAKTAMEYSRD